jgi:hypothetical protein
VIRRKISESADEPLDRLVASLLDGMIEVHEGDPELAALLDAEVPHRVDGTQEFSVRLYEVFRNALVPHAGSLGGVVKLDSRTFLLSNMLNALGHSLTIRRPRSMSLRVAKAEACKAILASLTA